MSDTINWLFFTDLHYGLDDHNWFWPKIRNDFYTDLGRIADQIGPWDLVFFTGDFVQSGQTAEFTRLNRELENLWKKLTKSGNTPLLCPVPGNHDLVRPDKHTALARMFTESWWNNEEARKRFWYQEKSEGREAIQHHFKNYENWLSQLPVPLLEPRKTGSLPGDFSAVFKKRGVSLGVVGLNSSFLQVAEGDLKGKLDLHVSQLNAVCDGDPAVWLKQNTASLLLTHHPPSWLDSKALDHYKAEIYPGGRFLAHFCGHQHESETSEISEAGGLPRRYRHGPSIFGLEEWQGTTPQRRIHGYMAGQYCFEGTNSVERYWPRVVVKTRDGAFKLCPDQSFNIQDDNCCVAPFEIEEEVDDAAAFGEDEHQRPFTTNDNQMEEPKCDINLFDKAPDLAASKSRLSSCPRFILNPAPHHKAVRQEEQSQFELELHKKRTVWLAADWGTGKDGFLAVALDRFRSQGTDLDVFHMLCDEADDENTLLALFPRQFGMPLQSFCLYAASLPCAILVLDGIQAAFCFGDSLIKIRRIVSAILEFCPLLKVVLVSRLCPDKESISSVELHPLEVPDARTYILHHPDATQGLSDSLVIDKIHERTDGLPMLLDRLLQSLKVSSLESVLDAEMEFLPEHESLSESVPRALVYALTTLEKSADKRSKRSLLLLKVLSLLPYGEPLETLKHFFPAEPFFIEHALQLHEMALLDAISLKSASPRLAFGMNAISDDNGPKLLKVPRQIGQYVSTLLNDDERSKIIDAGVERFFGRRWRDGKIKLRSLPCECNEHMSTGVGNEFAIVHHLISDAKRRGDIVTGRKAIKLGISYCNRLESENRFRDLLVVAGGLLQTTARNEMPEQWSELAALNGQALRMTGRHEAALSFLNDSLATGEKLFSNERKASIWLDIALAEESLAHSDLAIKAAQKVQGLVKSKSHANLHAVVIEAGLTLKGKARIQRLKDLERQSRESGALVLAGNIGLDLARETDDPRGKLEILNGVSIDKQDVYNRTRVVIEKASALELLDGVRVDLTNGDLISLSNAYSYLYSQRFGLLFDRCHSVLWNILEDRKDTTQLYRLFRYSSFLWRLRGDEVKEAEYLKRLSAKNTSDKEIPAQTGVILEFRYFMARFKVIVTGLVKAT